LTRDNAGRITSVGGDGATARGGRLRTASGNQRATQTARISGGRAAGTTAKPRGLKPESSRKLRTGVAVNRMRSINERMGNRPDIAEQNIRGRFSGQAGKRLDASIDRAVKQVKAAQTAALMKPKAQVKAERAAAAEAKRQAAAAKPKRTRTPESLRMSRAKQIEKRRSITTNPAGERASSAAKMAANAARTQERATAFLKAGGKAKPTTRAAAAAVKPVRAAAARPKASASQLGSRLNPAKKSIRAATRKADKAYARENRIRSSLFSGDKSLQARTAIEKELNKASNLTATMRQQVREVRSQFPVQTRDAARRAVGSRRAGTISQTKEVRNAVNRREAFKRKVTRAASISRPGNDKKARQSARTRAQAMATYQGARRPSETDRTVGQFGRGRVSTAFKAPSSRIAAPSRSARRQGRAMALAQTQIRDQFGRRTGNPVKQQRKRSTGRKAVKFYQNPTAAARELIQDRGKRGLSVRGFRQPRPRR
jgi:hypothetical protein